MATAAVPLGLPPCPDCAGGGQLNGLECRGCGGRGRLGVRPRIPASWRGVLRRWGLAAAGPAGVAAGKLIRWSAMVPGIGGAAAVTAGLSVIAHSVWHWLPAYGPALLVAGVFGLLADRRL